MSAESQLAELESFIDRTGYHPVKEVLAPAVEALRAVLDLVTEWETKAAAVEESHGVQVISVAHIAARVRGVTEEALA